MPLAYLKKKMDPLFLGVFNVIPCRVLWFPGGEPTRAYGRASTGKTIYGVTVKGLAADTTVLGNGIPLKLKRVSAIDSVFQFFNQHPDAKTISGQLFRTIRRTNFDARFIRNAITINQLKNAGGMRLIRNKQVSDSISSYDQRCEVTTLYNDFYTVNSEVGNRQFEKLFNASDLLTLYISNTSRRSYQIFRFIYYKINTTGLNEQLNFMMLEKAYARRK
jgi:hypothetical protein